MIARARHAEAAAEAIRDLNLATLNATIVESADVYDALGALSTLVSRLPQALRQLESAVAHRAHVGELRVDVTAPGLIEIANTIKQATADAIGFLDEAAAAIDGVHQSASHIWFDDGEDD